MRWWQETTAKCNRLYGDFWLDGRFCDNVSMDSCFIAFVFGLLNILIKPILVILSLPIACLTMGLFYFVINGVMISLTSFFVSGFGSLIILGVAICFFNSLNSELNFSC